MNLLAHGNGGVSLDYNIFRLAASPPPKERHMRIYLWRKGSKEIRERQNVKTEVKNEEKWKEREERKKRNGGRDRGRRLHQ